MGIKVTRGNNHPRLATFTYNEVLGQDGIFEPLDKSYVGYRFFAINSFGPKRMLIQLADDNTLNAVSGSHNWDKELFVRVADTLTIEVK